MENNENFTEGTTERVDSVDASKILNNAEERKQTSSDPSKAEGNATLAMIFGIVSIVGGFGGFISLGFAIAGLVLAKQAKRDGYDGTYQKVGYITSIVGIVLSAVSFLAVVGMLIIFGAGFVMTFVVGILGAIAQAARAAYDVVGLLI